MMVRPRARWGRIAALTGLLAVAPLVAACGSDESADPTSTVREAVDPDRVGPQGRVAQFVVECTLSHEAYDDPIVYPDEPGASHLHTFFGNHQIDADPDYDRVAGADTSCEQRRDTASYWAPALLDVTGQVVEPESMTAYYRPGFGVDPATVDPYPAGLMMVAGNALATHTQSTAVVAWSCGSSQRRDTEPAQCPEQESLRLWINFPDCWDGEHLRGSDETPVEVEVAGHDHEGHDHDNAGTPMALMRPAPTDHTAYSEAGACPASHPVPIPMLQLAIDYPSVAPEGLSLASGDIHTAHADFWNVWDQQKLEEEVELCLNASRVCGVTD